MIKLYQKRFCLEEMLRDLKSGGYNLEKTNIGKERLSKLLIIVAIAHTSAIMHAETIKKKGIQKYLVKPKSKTTSKRRHSSFYVDKHLHLWVELQADLRKKTAKIRYFR